MTSPHHGMDLDDAHAALMEAGGSVREVRRTGELLYSHPAVTKPVRVNRRRKDAPRSLTALLLKVLNRRGS